tara:strand:+ start:977 stop:1255 length:279 start_codon:yes stop_codon:yes gene_type:complete
MAAKRGLGVAGSSIFSKTVKEEETNENPEVLENKKNTKKLDYKNQVIDWKKCSIQFRSEHKELLDELAWEQRKEKRDMLAEIFEFYIKKNKL